jgi:hypothetical protein
MILFHMHSYNNAAPLKYLLTVRMNQMPPPYLKIVAAYPSETLAHHLLNKNENEPITTTEFVTVVQTYKITFQCCF